jgi:hypothetical protein
LVILIGGKRPFIFVAVAIVITYGVFFYLQALHENNLSASLLQEHKERQELLAASVTQNIGSDLDSALQRIKALAENFFIFYFFCLKATINGIFY